MYIMYIYVFTIYIYAFYMHNYAYYPALSVFLIIGPYTLTNSVSTNFFDLPQFPFFYKVGVISNGPFKYRSTDRLRFTRNRSHLSAAVGDFRRMNGFRSTYDPGISGPPDILHLGRVAFPVRPFRSRRRGR